MNRGAGGSEIFTAARDAELFLQSLDEATSRYATEVHAYCLMGNHFHLLVQSRKGRLSDFMRFVAGRFTRLWNLDRKTDGPIFRGRFTSKLIATDAHLMECLRYIHLNPVQAGFACDPDGWAWSSARAYAGLADIPPWLTISELMGMFGAPDARHAYKQFLSEGSRSGVRPGGSDTD
jgi:REP-associated tyrosine transposase